MYAFTLRLLELLRFHHIVFLSLYTAFNPESLHPHDVTRAKTDKFSSLLWKIHLETASYLYEDFIFSKRSDTIASTIAMTNHYFWTLVARNLQKWPINF